MRHHSKSAATLPRQLASATTGMGPAARTGGDALLTAKESAAEVHLSLAAFWRAVAARRLPPPLYPLPRAPRWRRSELRAALDATRALPAEAKAERRAVRLGLKRAGDV
jgi:predicted DNA-binding transcriptional regulator AlpA